MANGVPMNSPIAVPIAPSPAAAAMRNVWSPAGSRPTGLPTKSSWRRKWVAWASGVRRIACRSNHRLGGPNSRSTNGFSSCRATALWPRPISWRESLSRASVVASEARDAMIPMVSR